MSLYVFHLVTTTAYSVYLLPACMFGLAVVANTNPQMTSWNGSAPTRPSSWLRCWKSKAPVWLLTAD